MANRILDPGTNGQRLAYNRIIAILSATSAFAPYAAAGERYLLCQQAGILGPLGALDWTAPAAQVAGHIIDRLNNYGSGSLAGRPGFTALGALADHLLGLAEVPTDDHKWLAGLVVQYGLVTDRAYVDALAAKYGVVVPPVAAGAGKAAAPAVSLPVELAPAARLALAKALLRCPSVQNPQGRASVVRDLPEHIRLGISPGDTPLTDMRNIIDACLNYEGGLDLLIAAVRGYEGNSLSMREVDRLVR